MKKNGENVGLSIEQWVSRTNKSLYCEKAETNLNLLQEGPTFEKGKRNFF